jgi:hypothetical protein
MIKLTEAEAEAYVAELDKLIYERNAAQVTYSPDGAVEVTVRITNPKRGTSACWFSRHATGELPAAKKLAKQLMAELKGSSTAAAARIRAEKAPS